MCYYCKELEHIAMDCPNKTGGASRTKQDEPIKLKDRTFNITVGEVMRDAEVITCNLLNKISTILIGQSPSYVIMYYFIQCPCFVSMLFVNNLWYHIALYVKIPNGELYAIWDSWVALSRLTINHFH